MPHVEAQNKHLMSRILPKVLRSAITLSAYCITAIFIFSSFIGDTVNNESSYPNKKKVWIDADLAVGMERQSGSGYSDVDDGYAILQLMKSDQIEIKAISAVYGNTSIENAYALSKKMVRDFYDEQIPVYKGAGEAIDLENVESNEAVEAMADALKQEKLTIMAIGPATNVGLLLLKYPELKDQIEEVVLVAGRRDHTAYFSIGDAGYRARDANFDNDPIAFRLMFQHGVAVTLCPFEISHKVWIKKDDLSRLSKGSSGSQWLADESQNWIEQWYERGEEGFNPFDVLASHYLIAPEDIISEPLNARLEIHHDDTKADSSLVYKPYLICDRRGGYPIRYCYDVVNTYHEKLMASFE